MTNTTATKDTVTVLFRALDRVEVNLACAVSLVTDDAPSLIRKKAGVGANLKKKFKLQMEGIVFGFVIVYCIRKYCEESHHGRITS